MTAYRLYVKILGRWRPVRFDILTARWLFEIGPITLSLPDRAVKRRLETGKAEYQPSDL